MSSWERVWTDFLIFGSMLTTKVQNVCGLHSVNSRERLQVQQEESQASQEQWWQLILGLWCFFLELKCVDCLDYKLSQNKSSRNSRSVSCILHVFTLQWLHLCHALLSCSPLASGRYFRRSCGNWFHTLDVCVCGMWSAADTALSQEKSKSEWGRAVVSCMLDCGEHEPLSLTITALHWRRWPNTKHLHAACFLHKIKQCGRKNPPRWRYCSYHNWI